MKQTEHNTNGINVYSHLSALSLLLALALPACWYDRPSWINSTATNRTKVTRPCDAAIAPDSDLPKTEQTSP